MLRVISILVFLFVLGGICAYCVASAICKRYRWRAKDMLKIVAHLFTPVFIEQKLNLVAVLRKLLYLLTLLCFVVLIITGFYPVVLRGEHLSGYLLMVHVIFGPIFAVCLAILVVMWAANCQFDKNYWPALPRILARQAVSETAVDRYELLTRICFWLIVVLALPVILSIVLSMFLVFGIDGQEFLLHLHAYSALALAVVGILHTCLVIKAGTEENL